MTSRTAQQQSPSLHRQQQQQHMNNMVPNIAVQGSPTGKLATNAAVHGKHELTGSYSMFSTWQPQYM
jgi:hypothetical protein